MDNLAIQNQSSVIGHYSRNLVDKTYADQFETLLGHLICERGKGVKTALENLRPIVKTTHKQTLIARDWCAKLGFGGVGLGVLVGAGMGLGFAVLPIIAGTISLKFWSDCRNEIPRREAEYHLLKTVGDLPEALYALHLRGVDAVRLVSAYDALVVAIEGRLEDGKDFTEAEVGDFLRVKIESSTGLEATTQSQSGIQNGGAEGNARTESQPLAQTELQPNHSLDAGNMVAAAPSYGVSKVLSPLDRLLASPYQSRAWFGAQRTGKSYLAAVTSQQMAATLGTKVFHVNLHSFGTEDAAYWTHARSVTGDMGHLDEGSVMDLITRAIGVVKDFAQTQNALLIFDEITLTGARSNPYAEALQPLLKAVASSCSELASTGKKRRQAVWSISPDFVAGELVQEVKAIKSLTVTFVAIPPGRSLDWEGQAIGFHAESFGNVQRNFPALKDAPRMDCDRMVFVDDLWLDMGTLPTLMAPTSPPETTKLSQGQVNWERMKVGSPAYPEATDAIEVESWESSEAIEVEAVEVKQSHPLSDKFDRLEALMDGKDSLPIREIQRAFSCKSDEAQQIAQMFCMKQKSSYRFTQSTKANGVISKSIERV